MEIAVGFIMLLASVGFIYGVKIGLEDDEL